MMFLRNAIFAILIVLIKMDASIVDKDLIERINKGEEKAFEVLYNSYFVYLCACANSYIFNPVEAQDIVNETFAKIWYRRGELSFPIHAYLIRAIQNGCLNYLRSLHSRERIIDEYREALLEYQEEFCASECSPLQEMELADLEKSVQNIVSSLPDKCRFIFEQYLYSNLTPQEIADKNNISVNTVRVHVKNAMDKIREKVGSRVGILLFFFSKKRMKKICFWLKCFVCCLCIIYSR